MVETIYYLSIFSFWYCFHEIITGLPVEENLRNKEQQKYFNLSGKLLLSLKNDISAHPKQFLSENISRYLDLGCMVQPIC